MTDTWASYDRSVRRADLAGRVEIARGKIAEGPSVLSAFPARRRPILTMAGGFAFMVVGAIVWATATFWFWKLLGVDDDGFWFSTIQTAVMVAVLLPLAWGTRFVIAPCVDGSLVTAQASALRWSSGTTILATVPRDAAIEVEPSSPWWRGTRHRIDGESWYLSSHFEPERFDRWVALRSELPVATSTAKGHTTAKG